ncbi:MAG: pyridoxamine 5'-phosphate oxidase family protein [Fimbriimonas sp.]|nr:pyridoxamine 5'-phosphate oxidase family protein [Fimbriimonas sp.]
MLGNLDPTQIEEVLHGEALGRIGCHAGGRTYVVPVTYAYDGERVICHSGRGDMLRMMHTNATVCFEVEHVQSLADWKCVVADGRFEELEGDDAEEAARFLEDRLQPLIASATAAPYSVVGHGLHPDSVIFSIVLGRKTGRYEHP